MKTLRRISAATILSMTLAVVVLAGQIETPGNVPQPPQPPPVGGPTIPTSLATTVILKILGVIR